MSDKVTQNIFSAIKSGSYKIAQSLCSQQLSKYPNSSYFYALSGYIYFLNDEKAIAIKKCRELLLKTPSDPGALELLNLVFRKCNLYLESVLVYENACKKYPNLGLIDSWIDLSIKNFDILSLQKSSMLLVQHSPLEEQRLAKLKCAFNYSIASNLHKISKQHRLLFPRLGLKMIESIDPQGAQEIFVYVKLLLLSNKVEQAVSLMEEFLKKEKDLEIQLILLETLSKSKLWPQLYQTCEEILVNDSFDDWNTWCHFIEAASKVEKLDIVLDIAKKYPVSRNSKLAPLEVAKYTNSALEQDLISYMEHFAHKPCCFSDLKGFIVSVPDSFLQLLENQLESRNLTDIRGMKLDLNQTTFLVNYVRFQVLLKPELMTSAGFIKQLYSYYQSSEHLLKTKEKTDYFIANEFVLLIAQSLLKQNSCHPKELLKCVILLENAAKTDYHEFHVRLWLVRLYSLLNCYSKAQVHFNVLKIKFVQNDTLSNYLLSNVGHLFPTVTTLKDINRAQEIYSNNKNETTYMLGEAYDKSAFNKIEGFIQFGLRLENSVTKNLNLVETLNLTRITGDRAQFSKAYDELLKAYSLSLSTERERDFDEKLSDNRDRKIMWEFGSMQIDEDLNSSLCGPQRSELFIHTMICKELLILNDESNCNAKDMVEVLRKASTQTEFSDLEKWEFSLIAQLITIIKAKRPFEDFEKLLTVEYSNILNCESTLDNRSLIGYFKLLSISKWMNSIKQNYKTEIDEQLNKQLAVKSKQILEDIRKKCNGSKKTHVNTLDKLKKETLEWFKKDGEFLHMKTQVIDEVFNDVKESSLKSITLLTLI